MNLCILLMFFFFILIIYLSNGSDSEDYHLSQEVANSKVICHYSPVDPGDIRAMTFNLWYSGEQVSDGIKKIAHHINLLNPDFVCLQVTF